jgi:hypothetical protein
VKDIVPPPPIQGPLCAYWEIEECSICPHGSCYEIAYTSDSDAYTCDTHGCTYITDGFADGTVSWATLACGCQLFEEYGGEFANYQEEA